MSEIKLGKLSNADNTAILDRLHAESSIEYQRRVPLASHEFTNKVATQTEEISKSTNFDLLLNGSRKNARN